MGGAGAHGDEDEGEEEEGGRLPLGRKGQSLALDVDAPTEVSQCDVCVCSERCCGASGRLSSNIITSPRRSQVSFAAVSAAQADGAGLVPLEAFVLKALRAR